MRDCVPKGPYYLLAAAICAAFYQEYLDVCQPSGTEFFNEGTTGSRHILTRENHLLVVSINTLVLGVA
jgi:hypothetical protein